MKGPVLIHVKTQKGRGYGAAENKPQEFHSISPFEIETGEVRAKNGPTYSDVFGRRLVELAAMEPKLVAITAAMPLQDRAGQLSKAYPDRFFDVGIAERRTR